MTNAAADMLAMIAQQLAGPEVAVAATNPRQDHPGDSTDVAVANAVAKRKREFRAGRAAARRAMRVLGRPDQPVPMGEDRAPIWPEGLIGSITHTNDSCVACVANASDRAMLGIDLEPAEPLDHDLIAMICTGPERAWIATQPDPALAAKRIFSAKEAAYKAQYPLTRQLFGFEALEVTFDTRSDRVTARFISPVGPFSVGTGMTGRQVIIHQLILSLVDGLEQN